MEALQFPKLKAGVAGLSDHAIRLHLALYERYVQALSDPTTLGQLSNASSARDLLGEYRGGKSRETHVRNAIHLHEAFFGALILNPRSAPASLETAIVSAFGSMAAMILQLKTAALAFDWAVLLRDRASNELRVVAIEGHSTGMPAGHDLILAIDAWEHSYVPDFDTAKEPYLDAVLAAVDWQAVQLVRDAGSVRAALSSVVLAVPPRHQSAPWSCGAAAVRSVLAFFEKDEPEGAIVEAAGTTPEIGTTSSGVLAGLERYEVRAEAAETLTHDALLDLLGEGRPIILDVDMWGGKHWVVAHGIVGDGVMLMDPADGLSRVQDRPSLTATRWSATGPRGGIVVGGRHGDARRTEVGEGPDRSGGVAEGG